MARGMYSRRWREGTLLCVRSSVHVSSRIICWCSFFPNKRAHMLFARFGTAMKRFMACTVEISWWWEQECAPWMSNPFVTGWHGHQEFHLPLWKFWHAWSGKAFRDPLHMHSQSERVTQAASDRHGYIPGAAMLRLVTIDEHGVFSLFTMPNSFRPAIQNLSMISMSI